MPPEPPIGALLAGGRSVFVCAVDLPLVTPVLVRAVAEAPPAPVAVPRAQGRLQPLFARYAPEALPGLRAAAPDEALTATVESLAPHVLDLPGDAAGDAFVNVNTPDELAAVAQIIARD